jgi:hypothetical protein
MTVDPFRCSGCGSPDLIAIAPGHEPERHPTVGLIERPVPTRCWCAACWATKFGSGEKSA